MSDELVRWTARLAVACYLARLLMDVAFPSSPRRNHIARWVWTTGCVLLLVHFAAVFQYVHHWSFAAAWDHTRQRTLALTGWDSGDGIYANYAIAGWWVVDVLLWWRDERWPRQGWAYWPMQVYFAFLMFNATVVFGPGWWMVAAAVFGVIFAALWVFRSRAV